MNHIAVYTSPLTWLIVSGAYTTSLSQLCRQQCGSRAAGAELETVAVREARGGGCSGLPSPFAAPRELPCVQDAAETLFQSFRDHCDSEKFQKTTVPTVTTNRPSSGS